jgi:two-component system, LytTR family, response regulator
MLWISYPLDFLSLITVRQSAAPNFSHGREPSSTLVVASGERMRIVQAARIDWAEAEGVYVRLHSADGAFVIRMPMHTLEARLDPTRFVRIHRSFIVNIDRVRELRQAQRGDYDIILQDGTALRLSRGRRGNLERLLGSDL